jgi:O-acetyl-ADP-ribose deacetylase (regulator of RNase III)
MRLFDCSSERVFDAGGAGLAVAELGALQFAVGDITCELADAIVNPVGGLVDIAVQQAAGPLLLEERHEETFARYGFRLAAGQAVVTPGFDLPARHVIHCAPPAYHDGPEHAAAALARCHVQALGLARELGARSVSFPAIGTGAYRFPVREAAAIAVRAVLDELGAHARPPVVRFVFDDPAMLEIYRQALAAARADLAA